MCSNGVIRLKSKCYEKMKDKTIRNKWKQEALEQDLLTAKHKIFDIRGGIIPNSPLGTRLQIDYVLSELVIQYKMDVWICLLLMVYGKMMNYVNSIENIPENRKDWHSETNSLFIP